MRLAGQRCFCCCHVPVFALALQRQHRGVFLTCLLMLRSLQQTAVSLAYTISCVACCQLPHSNSGKSTSAKWIWLMWDWDPTKPSWFTAVFNGLQHSGKTWPSSCDSRCWWFCQPLLPECSKKYRSYMRQLFAFLDLFLWMMSTRYMSPSCVVLMVFETNEGKGWLWIVTNTKLGSFSASKWRRWAIKSQLQHPS